mgnify:CR=1 FL=1|tara:strand:+ start:564 stop:1613 length:1050 start_codon:yes stop_codon:yes gene_type:complete
MSIANLKRQNARGVYPSETDRQELRQQSYGYINMAAASTPLLINAVNQQIIQNSWGAPAVQIPVFKKDVGTATASTLTCTFLSDNAEAALMNLTFINAHVGFDIIPRLTDQSDIVTEAQDFMRQFSDKEEALANFLEAAIYNALDTAAASTSDSAFIGAGAKFGALVGDAVQVSAAQSQFWFNDLKSIFQADKFQRSGLDVIGDAQLPSFVNQYTAQGAANSTNSLFQFNGYQFQYSNSTVTTAGATSTGFAMPKGSVAVISRVSPDAANNRVSMADGIRWSTETSELLGGLEIELMVKDKCSDVSATTGNALDTNALVKSYQMGLNCCIVTPYNTGTNGGIKKFDLLP